VTVASNLPSGDAAGSNEGSSELTTETRERANFDVSETRREMVMAPGAIKRLSVAVLVNSMATGGNGAAAADQTRTEAELADLRELVSAAVGLNAERGDVLTLKALDFTAAPALGTAPAIGMFERAGLNVWQLIQLGVMALVTLVLGLFVIRPLLLSQGNAAPAFGESSGLPVIAGTASEEPLPEPGGAAGDMGGLPALEGGLPALSVVSDFDMDGDPLGDAENPIQRLKQAIETRQPDTLEILREWMDPGINETEEA
jgi:flagellar M-ring protein FliF